MARLLLGLVVVVVVATVYAVIDCAMIANQRVRGLSKPAWIIVILLIPVIGLLLWFIIGRGRRSKLTQRRLAPDDDPSFTGAARPADPDQDERIRRLEEELASLDADIDPRMTGTAGFPDDINPGQEPVLPDDTRIIDDLDHDLDLADEGDGTATGAKPDEKPTPDEHKRRHDDRGDIADA